ncbi:EthD domain-containing protein [Paraburkholderia hayleyella]|uniref:EthD domain-containing protein n=1 Tax=Paraburkholderia hayleyella TaxID=2152889 RepID=UPI0012915121|nr:EthD domain-containing protein [Paraburkholderia hayleyella]
MEKIIYILWRDGQIPPRQWSRTLRTELTDRLLSLGAHGIQINTADTEVEAAAALRQQNTYPCIDGTAAVWIDSAVPMMRQPFDDTVRAIVPHCAAYLVTESQLIRNTRFPPKAGERTPGFSQLVFLTRPPRLTHEAWLDVWQNHHTRIAIETLDNFLYIQNVVVRPLTHGAPGYDAIIEECYPEAAMTDLYAIFKAVGDVDQFQRNFDELMRSCARFIDFDKIDVVPTSQYVVKPMHG